MCDLYLVWLGLRAIGITYELYDVWLRLYVLDIMRDYD